jgi:hypothetical protein
MIHKGKQITILLVGLIALGAIATWDEWQSKKDEKLKETTGLIIPDLKSEDIAAIRFMSLGDRDAGGDKATKADATAKTDEKPVDVKLVRKEGQWVITSPISTTADTQIISDLLKNILEYKSEKDVAGEPEKWADFGLKNPRRTIELETSSGKTVTFMVGDNAPVGFSAYVATSASTKVFSGSQYIATATLKSLFDLRNKRVLTGINTPEISSVSISSGKDSTMLEKVDNSWQITAPTKAKADTVLVNNLIDDISGLKATEIIDEPNATLRALFADNRGLARMTIQSSTSKITLRLAEQKADLYATVEGQPAIYKLNAEVKGKIIKTGKDLRDKRIFSFQSAEITGVTVDGQNFKLVAGDWYTESDAAKFSLDGKFSGKPEDKPTTASHIRGLIVDLEYARAEDVKEDPSSLKLPKAPKHQIILSRSSDADKITVDAWLGTGADSEMVWLKTAEMNRIYKAKKSVLAGIAPQASKPPVGDELSLPPISN